MSVESVPILEDVGGGRFLLRGDLSFRTVPGLWGKTRDLASRGTALTVDLSGVGRSDSAGVALLIEWLRDVHRAGNAVSYVNIPPQMLAIARASSIDSVLPLARE